MGEHRHNGFFAWLRHLPRNLCTGYLLVVRDALKSAREGPDPVAQVGMLILLGVLPGIVFGVLFVGALSTIPFTWLYWLGEIWTRVKPYMANEWLRAIGTLAIFTVAVLLYRMRSDAHRGRLYYALMELTAGITLAWTALSPFSSSGLPSTLALVGALYALVRGLDNLQVGLAGWGGSIDREPAASSGHSSNVPRPVS